MIDLLANMVAEGIRALGLAGWIMTLMCFMVVTGGVLCFFSAAGAELWVRFHNFLDRFSLAMEAAGSRAALALLVAAQIIYELVAIALLTLAAPPSRTLVANAVAARLRLRYAYAFTREGHRMHATFAEFAAAKAEEEAQAKVEDEDLKRFHTSNAKSAMPEDLPAFDRAMAIFGISAEEARDMRKVRQRYRELMMIVHPDKQFPNQLFAQMINEALAILKKENGAA